MRNKEGLCILNIQYNILQKYKQSFLMMVKWVLIQHLPILTVIYKGKFLWDIFNDCINSFAGFWVSLDILIKIIFIEFVSDFLMFHEL